QKASFTRKSTSRNASSPSSFTTSWAIITALTCLTSKSIGSGLHRSRLSMVYLRATMTQRLIFHNVSLPEYSQGPEAPRNWRRRAPSLSIQLMGSRSSSGGQNENQSPPSSYWQCCRQVRSQRAGHRRG